MARTDSLGHFLTDIADAIREKKGTTETITASDFDTEIENLPGGGDISEYIDNVIDGTSNVYASRLPKIIKKLPSIMSVNGANLGYAFQGANISNAPTIDTSNVTNMRDMFNGCANLVNVPLYNTSNVTDMRDMFNGCRNLTTIPQFDTQNVTNMDSMFRNCPNLTTIPVLDTRSVKNMDYMFGAGGNHLTDESLDNILQMCINATSYTGTKELTTLGFTNKRSRIEALPHYQDFINAGWSIGYN